MATPMRRVAHTKFSVFTTANSSKRTAQVDHKIEVDPSRLYLNCSALHWEQDKPALPKEKARYQVARTYSGNDNGDFFEGGRNVVWACRNAKCTNNVDCQPDLKRFLKYEGKDTCPFCGSEDIYDWEYEAFQTKGELLAKTQDGRYRYETWKGEPVNINHNSDIKVGRIEDVWVEPPTKTVVELLSIDRTKNARLAAKIDQGLVDSGSMELLTGLGLCSICSHIHTTESEFCDHLATGKGGVDQKSGQRIFEICKSIQGCGHAIIETGEPADEGAVFRGILASKQENANLNQDMAQEQPIVGKPQVQRAAKTVSLQPTRTASSTGLEDKPIDVSSFDKMKEQFDTFGSFDSTRSAKDLKVAKMSPEEKAEQEEFEAFRAAKKKGQSTAVGSANPTLRVDKEFVALALKHLKGTKKCASRTITNSLIELMDEANRPYFKKALSVRKNRSNILQKLLVRKAQVEGEEVKEVLLDVLGDALIDAGENLKYQINDVTLEDADQGALELIVDPAAEQEFLNYLEEPEEIGPEEGQLEEEDPLVVHEDENQHDKGLEALENYEDNMELSTKDKKRAQAIEAGEPARSVTTSATPRTKQEAKPAEDGTNIPKVEGEGETLSSEYTPGSEQAATLVKALRARVQILDKRIAQGDEGFNAMLTERTRILAQIKSISPELTPTGSSDNLGGNGLNENPKPVPHVSSGKTIAPELTPTDESDNLGGNGLNENPKPVIHVARLARAQEISKRLAEEGAKGVSAADIALLKEMGILPKDFKAAQSEDASDKVEPSSSGKGESVSTEEFPESKEDAQIEKGKAERTLELEVTPGSEDITDEKKTAQSYPTPASGKLVDDKGMLKSDKEDVESKGQMKKTPVGEADKEMLKNQGAEDPTGVGDKLGKPEAKDKGWEETTPLDKNNKEQGDNLGWDKKTKPGDKVGDEEANLNWKEVTPIEDTYPDAEQLKAASLSAKFTPMNKKGEASSSFWTLFNGQNPLYRVALKDAFPGEEIKSFKTFASNEYGRSLVANVRRAGLKTIHEDVFGGAGVLVKKKAQAQMPAQVAPTAPAQPANVDPQVADKIMNDATPGISVIDLLSKLAAPIIAESETLSTSGFVEELVNIANDQAKVEELTQKVDKEVQDIKSLSGSPTDQSTSSDDPNLNAGIPPVSNSLPDQATLPNQTSMAGMDNASPASNVGGLPTYASLLKGNRTMTAELLKMKKKYSAMLAAQKIEPLVRKAQELGVYDNYNSLKAKGISRMASKREAARIFASEVTRLIGLPEEAFMEAERGLRVVIAKLSKGEMDAGLAKRQASSQRVKQDAGGIRLLGSLPGSTTEAKTFSPNESPLGDIQWRMAKNIDDEEYKKQSKKFEERGSSRE